MLVLKRRTGESAIITVNLPNGEVVVIRVKMYKGKGSLVFSAPREVVTVVREEISEHRVS